MNRGAALSDQGIGGTLSVARFSHLARYRFRLSIFCLRASCRSCAPPATSRVAGSIHG